MRHIHSYFATADQSVDTAYSANDGMEVIVCLAGSTVTLFHSLCKIVTIIWDMVELLLNADDYTQ